MDQCKCENSDIRRGRAIILSSEETKPLLTAIKIVKQKLAEFRILHRITMDDIGRNFVYADWVQLLEIPLSPVHGTHRKIPAKTAESPETLDE